MPLRMGNNERTDNYFPYGNGYVSTNGGGNAMLAMFAMFILPLCLSLSVIFFRLVIWKNGILKHDYWIPMADDE